MISSKLQLEIIKSCVSKIHRGSPSWKYLVNPKFQRFEFNSFFRRNRVWEKIHTGVKYDYDRKKEETLKLLGWNEEDFLETQNLINSELLNKTNTSLLDFSDTTKCDYIISFSGVSKNLVFVDIVQYPKFITTSELNSSTFNRNQRFMSATCLIYVLKDNKIEKEILDCDIVNN